LHRTMRAVGGLQVDIDQTIKEDNRWHAAIVQLGKEQQACNFLRIRQVKAYWPRYLQEVRLARHRAGVRWQSVLPGYLFIAVPMDKTIDCSLIKQAPGFLTLMRTADGLAQLTLADMECIREIEAALSASQVAAVKGIPFKVGQRVMVGGNLAWTGPIVRIENKRRIVVEIFMLGRTHCIPVPVNKLEAATRAAA
jgi:transcription antitermination factor NusG